MSAIHSSVRARKYWCSSLIFLSHSPCWAKGDRHIHERAHAQWRDDDSYWNLNSSFPRLTKGKCALQQKGQYTQTDTNIANVHTDTDQTCQTTNGQTRTNSHKHRTERLHTKQLRIIIRKWVRGSHKTDKTCCSKVLMSQGLWVVTRVPTAAHTWDRRPQGCHVGKMHSIGINFENIHTE